MTSLPYAIHLNSSLTYIVLMDVDL